MKKITSILAGGAFALMLGIPAFASGPQASHTAWPPETLNGTIGMVEAGQHILVIDNDNVPFDMVVTPHTRILYNNRPVTLSDLQHVQSKSVTVRFTPEGRGDIARSIRIEG